MTGNEFQRSKSDTTREYQNQDNQQDQTKTAARAVSPIATMTPRRKRADEHENEQDE